MSKPEFTNDQYLEILVKAILRGARHEELYAVAREIERQKEELHLPL